MRRWFIHIVILLTGLGLAQSAAAQQEGQRDNARVVTDQKSGVEVTRPEGWAKGKAKNGGAIAVFRASSDPEAQIDVLVSPLKRTTSATAYFTSFHANLQKAGLVKQDVRKESTYAGKTGVETEYDAASKDRQFRLIVWQFHKDGVAVLVTGFFPTRDRDRHYDDFQEVIESVELK